MYYNVWFYFYSMNYYIWQLEIRDGISENQYIGSSNMLAFLAHLCNIHNGLIISNIGYQYLLKFAD